MTELPPFGNYRGHFGLLEDPKCEGFGALGGGSFDEFKTFFFPL